LECAVPSVAMAPLERGKQRRCSGDIRGALDFMGAYVTPPGDINAVYTRKRHARAANASTIIRNNELADFRSDGRPSTCTVAMQQGLFPHHSCTVASAVKGEKSLFIDIQVVMRVINRGDDTHCDFRLDFRDAIAHCDLVQRNHVTSSCYSCNWCNATL
jgi:hypothetical protein